MDAKMFGAFLAQVRRAQSLTQAELAEQLHVTDKAVSTWGKIERAVEDRIARSLNTLGVPTKRDINKLSKSVVELSAVVQQLAAEKAKPTAHA